MRITGENIGLYRERVSANIKVALAQVVFVKQAIKYALASVICAACRNCTRLTADKT